MMGHLPGIMSKLLLFVKRSFFDESLVLAEREELCQTIRTVMFAGIDAKVKRAWLARENEREVKAASLVFGRNWTLNWFA
mmetsp:Transcript_7067/g.18192  ORF Transcript_7067/g.18192 Transcript_7067/m.18192 type:complete len:80 (-) Transcript_7067:1346-1585(-)